MAEKVVLEEEYDPNYVPTKEEIEEYVEFLGMDINKKEDLFWQKNALFRAPFVNP